MKMRFFLLLALIALVPFAAHAQVFSDKPLCLTLANKAGNEVTGHIETDQFRDPSGKLSWHRSNFRLADKEERQVCSTGPFFEGYKLRVVVKTVIPLYSCKTEMNRTVTITRGTDEYGLNTYFMDCPNEKAAPTAK